MSIITHLHKWDAPKEICFQFLDELHNKANLDVIDEYVDLNVVSHDPFPGQKPGSEGVKDTEIWVVMKKKVNCCR